VVLFVTDAEPENPRSNFTGQRVVLWFHHDYLSMSRGM
jgi:hypothetical protein